MFVCLLRPRLPIVVVSMLCTLAGLGVTGMAPPAARAEPLAASLVYHIEQSNVAAGELTPIDMQVQGTFVFFRGSQPKAWGCVSELKETVLNPEPMAPRVRVDVEVSRASSTEFEETVYYGDYTVAVTLSIRGQPPQTLTVQVPPTDTLPFTVGVNGAEREDVERIADRAAMLLNNLMSHAQPCVAKAKLKMRGHRSGPAYDVTVGVQAEGDLNLREDGTIDTVVPVTLTRTQSGACAISAAAPGRLQVTGRYGGDDGMLALQLHLSTEPEAGAGTCAGGVGTCTAGGGTLTCTVLGSSNTQPDPGAELDLTSGGALVVALADQTSVALPPPAPGSGWSQYDFSWDGSLELTYGSEGAAVAALPSAAMISPAP